jgi:OOP family OmpA-OmpF porin
MKFRIKKTLIGVATASLLAPMASHADTGKGKWIFDGFARSVGVGRGTTCVAAGGDDHAFDAPDCTAAADTAAAARRAEADAKAAAAAESAAAAEAARQEALLAVEPGSGLKPGERGAYVFEQPAAAPIRDGFGRSCIKNGFWAPEYATEDCHPELYNAWRAKQAQPAQELAPRVVMPPPEVAPAAAAEAGGPEQPDAGPGVAPAAAVAAEAAPVVDNNMPDFPVTKYEYAAPVVAVAPLVAAGEEEQAEEEEEEELFAAEDVEDEEPPVFAEEEALAIPEEEVVALAEDEDDEAGPAPEDDEDDLPTPDMMLSEADRTLPEEAGLAAGATALALAEDEEDEPVAAGDDEEDEVTTPEMMLTEEDRTLPEEEAKSPGVAVLTDTSPGIAPPPEKRAETPPVIDNTVADFPVTTYTVEREPEPAPPPKKPVPTELPVTIQVDEDGFFDFDKSELRSDTIAVLDAVVGMLKDAKYDAVDVIGHADPIGTMRYNQALSERRAAAVKKYLVDHGIDPARINAYGKGEMELIVTREDCKGLRKKALIECLQPNRRVDIRAAGSKAAK